MRRLYAVRVAGVIGIILILIFAFSHSIVAAIGFKSSALEILNRCSMVSEKLGAPITENLWSLSYGTARSSGAFGTVSWTMGVEGSRAKGRYDFSMEKHGGVWGLTSGDIVIQERSFNIKNCNVGDDAGDGSSLMNLVQDCNAEKESSCQTLGILFLRGTGITKNLKQAKFYLERACDLGLKKHETFNCNYTIRAFTDGTNAVADPYEVGNIKSKLGQYTDDEEKSRLLQTLNDDEKNCESDDMNSLDSCLMLGRQFAENPAVKKDMVKAEKYISYACDREYAVRHPHMGRNPWAQYYYAAEFFHRGDHGFPKNFTKALKLAEKICDIAFAFSPVEPRGCVEAANLIDELIGKGSPQAQSARDRACKAGQRDAC